MTGLRFRGNGTIRSEEVFSPFWIEWVEFGLDHDLADDAAALHALLGHESYVRDLTSYGGGDRAAHGPYYLDELSPSSFVAVEPGAAIGDLTSWLAEGSEPHGSLRTLGSSFIERLLVDGRVYRLPDVRPRHETDLGFLLGSERGYNEWVFIDGASTTLTLVIATDD